MNVSHTFSLCNAGFNAQFDLKKTVPLQCTFFQKRIVTANKSLHREHIKWERLVSCGSCSSEVGAAHGGQCERVNTLAHVTNEESE